MASRKLLHHFARVSCFVGVSLASVAKADWLSLIVISPKPALDWSSPSKLAQTAGTLPQNEFGSPIGHVNVELRCDAIEGQPEQYLLTGMTNYDDNEAVDLVMNRGLGLGILFYDLKGKLQDAAHITNKVVKPLRDTDRMSLLRLAITSPTCRRLLQYFHEFKERGDFEHYGLPNRPRHGEGGGCSAFGVSFVDVAGLLDPTWEKAWSRSVRVPEALVGQPGTQPVSLMQIIMSAQGQKWAAPQESGRDLFLYDPALMRDWIQRIWNTSTENLPEDVRKNIGDSEKFGGQVIDIDRRNIPTPTEPIWLAPSDS